MIPTSLKIHQLANRSGKRAEHNHKVWRRKENGMTVAAKGFQGFIHSKGLFIFPSTILSDDSHDD